MATKERLPQGFAIDVETIELLLAALMHNSIVSKITLLYEKENKCLSNTFLVTIPLIKSLPMSL